MYRDAIFFLELFNNKTEKSNYVQAKNDVMFQFEIYEYITPVIAVIIMCLNLSVVVSSGISLKRHYEPRNMYLFLGNISIADFFLGILIILKQFYPNEWMTQRVCEIITGTNSWVLLSSCFSTCLIAIDRFLYIFYGLKYKIWMYSRRARQMILATWLLSFLIGYIPPLQWSQPINIDGEHLFCWRIVLFSPYVELIQFLIAFLPIMAIIVIYLIIITKALRKVRLIRHQESSDNVESSLRITRDEGNRRRDRWWRAIKVVLMSATAAFIAWVPFIVSSFHYMSCAKTIPCIISRMKLGSSLGLLVILNSFLNPLIYAWWHKGFRESIQKIYYHKPKKPPPITNPDIYIIKINYFDVD